MNALFAPSRDRAILAGRALGLSKDEWQFYGIGEGLGAPRFEKVVVLLSREERITEAAREYLEQRLPLTLGPEGRIHFIP